MGLRDQLEPLHLSPLWDVLHALVPPQPDSPADAALWRYDDVRPLLMQAGQEITAEEAERRVLILENPGLVGTSAITRSLYAGVQLVLPGEVAPCHRHAQSALRFVLEASTGSQGAYTAVNGEKVMMRPFDLVLTPTGLWHDHGNDSDAPIIWLDGLDIPLLQTLDCGYAERYGEAQFPPSNRPGTTLSRFGQNMRPVRPSSVDTALAYQPLFHYPYDGWRGALMDMAATGAPEPDLGYKMEFTNPVHGGPVMATISAFGHFLPKGFEASAYKQTSGAVYTVCEGSGTARIGDKRFALSPRDTFVVPSWQPLFLSANDDLILFSFSDQAVQDKLGLWRDSSTH
ncbi:MAG: gentisate 1,2-dioxygenase [Pseudomonadota bacterium]